MAALRLRGSNYRGKNSAKGRIPSNAFDADLQQVEELSIGELIVIRPGERIPVFPGLFIDRQSAQSPFPRTRASHGPMDATSPSGWQRR